MLLSAVVVCDTVTRVLGQNGTRQVHAVLSESREMSRRLVVSLKNKRDPLNWKLKLGTREVRQGAAAPVI